MWIPRIILKRNSPEDVLIDRDRCIGVSPYVSMARITGLKETVPVLEDRRHGDFANSAFWLNSNFDWEIGTDSDGAIILIPLKRISGKAMIASGSI